MAVTNCDSKIEAEEVDYLYTKVSLLPNAGLGLFAAILIYKDETIALFEGEILTPIEAKKRIEAGMDQYFINLLNGQIMDSKHVDCFAKYANDASAFNNSGLKNNAIITLDENENVCLKANRNILMGEEILCSYGKKYWTRPMPKKRRRKLKK